MPPRAPMVGQLLPPNASVRPFQPPNLQPMATGPQQPPAGFPGAYPKPGLPPPNFFPNSVANTPGVPPFPAALSNANPIPLLQPMPTNSPVSGAPPHSLFPQSQISEGPRQLYFDMPAGIMTQHIRLEDFDYSPINPKDMRIPLVTPPTERLLKALEAFYAPPSHEHPRNVDGWEKLGLYEFFKQKSQARKEYESKVGTIDPIDDDDSNENDLNSNGLSEDKAEKSKKDDNRSPSPQKRRYKEFKEEKDSR